MLTCVPVAYIVAPSIVLSKIVAACVPGACRRSSIISGAPAELNNLHKASHQVQVGIVEAMSYCLTRKSLE